MNALLPISRGAIGGLEIDCGLQTCPTASLDFQDMLVPPIRFAGRYLQAYGQTIPKDDIGGDLVDLVADGPDVIAYVTDVSGHGLRAGLLMGMIKTAVRYGLLLRQPLPKLLEGLNQVLPAVKQPNMFATFSALRFDGSNYAEYISAGHIPLVHYRRRFGDVVQHAQPQFPLGLFPAPGYASLRIPFEPGDLFALVSDGITEICEDQDADFGSERLNSILRTSARRPLGAIFETIRDGFTDPGLQHDDQTVLLLRPLETLETRWHGRLDGLATELLRD